MICEFDELQSGVRRYYVPDEHIPLVNRLGWLEVSEGRPYIYLKELHIVFTDTEDTGEPALLISEWA